MRAALTCTSILLALAPIGPGLFVFQACAEDDGSVRIRADGYAEGQGRTAEAAALADAEFTAVEVAVLDIVGDEWLDEVTAVFAQHATYIRTARPLEVDRAGDGVRVRAEVYVYTGQLRRDIAALLFNALPVKPAVAVLFGEQIQDYRNWTVGDGAAQRYFAKRFQDAGFNVVDVSTGYSAETLMAYQSGNARQLAGFGREARADIVVRGDATAQVDIQAGAVNVRRVTAKLEVDLVRSGDGLVVERFEATASVNSPDPGMGGEQAIEDAATRIVQDILVSAVIADATQPPPTDFIVSVQLPTDGPWLTRARKGIGERLPQAQLFDLHHSPGHAKFRVALDVSLSSLVHGLTDEPFAEFQLVTQRAVGRELDLELVPLP